MLRVVGALIEEEGRYLLCRRRDGDARAGRWEFPGGKVERGETDGAALKRELAEELGIDAVVGDLVGVFEEDGRDRRLVFVLYACRIRAGSPRCLQCQEIRMVTMDEAKALDLTPVDRKAVSALTGTAGEG